MNCLACSHTTVCSLDISDIIVHARSFIRNEVVVVDFIIVVVAQFGRLTLVMLSPRPLISQKGSCC